MVNDGQNLVNVVKERPLIMNGSAFDVLPVSQNEAPSRIRKRKHLIKRFAFCLHYCILTLDSGIDVGQGINVGPGKVGKNNKCRAWKILQK